MLRMAGAWAGVVVAAGLVSLVVWSELSEAAPTAELLALASSGAAGEEHGRTVSPLLRGADLASGSARCEVGSSARCTLEGLVFSGGGPATARVSLLRLGEPQITGFEDLEVSASMRRLLSPVLGDGDRVAVLRAGADGRFRVEGLALGVYKLVGEGDDRRRGAALVTMAAPGERREVRLDLIPAGEQLLGRARWSDGRPFVGLIEVSDEWGEIRPVFGARQEVAQTVSTDAEGRFVASGLPPGWAYLTAYEPGAWRSNLDWVKVPRTGVYEFVVDSKGRPLAGRVLEGRTDSPLADALVIVTGDPASRNLGAAVRSGPDGAFIVASAPETATVWVRRPGYGIWQRTGVDTSVPLVVRMHRGAQLVGRVTDPEGAPVPGLEVCLEGTSWPGTARTDADGRYRLVDLAPGTTRVLVGGGGWTRVEGPAVSAAQGEQVYDRLGVDLWPGETREVDVVVERGWHLDVEVRAGDGAPASGALVHVAGGEKDPWHNFVRTGSQLVTDERGRVHFNGLRDHEYSLYAQHPGGGWQQCTAKASREPGEALVVLELGAARWIDVETVNATTGQPLAGVEVNRAVTGPDGRARVGPFGPDKVRIRPWAEGYVCPTERIVAADAPAGVPVRVELWPAGSLRGSVRFPDGKPAGAMKVVVRSAAEDARWQGWQNRSGADGSFELTVIRDTALTLHAEGEAQGHAWAADLAVPSQGEGAALTLVKGEPVATQGAPEVGFTLRLVDDRGRAVAKARIDSPLGDVRCPEPGVFVWGDAPSEEALFQISAACDETGAPLPLASCVAGPFRETERDVTVRLEEERAVTGFVVDEEGHPVPGVGVRAVPTRAEARPPERMREHALSSTRSDARGRFRLAGLAGESYVLRIAVPPGKLAPPRTVVEGGEGDVEIRLRSPKAVEVRVLDGDGRPVKGACVECLEARWAWSRHGSFIRREESVCRQIAAADGVVHLPDLDPDRRYTLSVTDKEPRDDQFVDLSWIFEDDGSISALEEEEEPWFPDADPVREEGWLPRATTVILAGASQVEGRVVDERGLDCPFATVFSRAGGGSWTPSACSGRGAFALTLRGAGTFELAAGAAGSQAPHARAPVVRVRSGAVGVRVPRGQFGTLHVRVEARGADCYGGALDECFVTGVLELQGAHDASANKSVSGGTSLTFADLDEEATYTLWVRVPTHDLCALLRDVRASALPLRVRVEPNLSIGGRYRAPRLATDLEVKAIGPHPGIVVDGRLTVGGQVQIEGLTQGRWTIVATGRLGSRDLEARAEVEAGESVVLDLAPK